MPINKLYVGMDNNKEILQKEVKSDGDVFRYWSYYLGETVNNLATEEARNNASKLLILIEDYGKENFPNWIEHIFISEDNKLLLEEVLKDSIGITSDGLPITAMVMVFLDNMSNRPITQYEWSEFSKLKVVINHEKEKEMKANTKEQKETKVDQEFKEETESVKKEKVKEDTKVPEEEVKEEEEKMSTWKKVAIGATAIAAIAGAAWFYSKD